MTAVVASTGEPLLRHADITSVAAAVGSAAPERLRLLSEYLALQPSNAMRLAAEKEQLACRAADKLAERLNHARLLELEESPSEKLLIDSAIQKCSKRVADGQVTVRTAEQTAKRQRHILERLYPTHPLIDPTREELDNLDKRMHTLRRAIRDQKGALSKLNDASNLLLLISDHVQLMISCYAGSCTSASSSGEWSSEDGDGVKVGCLGRSEESRSMIYLAGVPGNYRIRYMRRCWGYAAEAIGAAVKRSSYLARQMEREGQSELVPGVAAQAKRNFSLFELPGGLTFVFRSDMVHRMASDAKEMREVVESWYLRQHKFIAKVGKDLAKSKKKYHQQELRLADMRRSLLSEEFADSCETQP